MDHNADQIAEWNGVLGERWAQMQADLDVLTRPFGEAALTAAKVASGEQVIDVGCGCGDTTLALARAVGAGGKVLGVDVSAPMLAVAEARRGFANLTHLSFAEADASSAELPTGLDLIFSRFGVMFFDAPQHAFEHLRQTLAPGGRMAFCCWRAPRENPWAMAPLAAARKAVGVETPPADPFAPGPFAFADPARLDAILTGAGFHNVDIKRFDAPVRLGSSLREAVENSFSFGPASRFIREVGEHVLPVVTPAIEAALTPYLTPDGSVAPPGAVWIVTATRG